MRKTILFALTLFSAVALSAQTTGQIALNSSGGGSVSGANAQITYLLGPLSERGDKTDGADKYGIQGSAFTSDKFLSGKLYYKDEFQGTIYYRYNAYLEEIEISKIDVPGAPTQELNRDKKISLNSATGNKIQFRTYIDKKKRTQNGYLTQLLNGKYSLHKRIDVKYTQAQRSQNSFIKATPARFTQFVEYYVQKEGVNRIDEVLPKKGKLFNILEASEKEAVKAFLKENDLNLKNEADLIKVFEFLNK